MTKDKDLLKNCYKKEDIDIKIRFYQTPKFLIHSETYKDLGLSEKLVYSILRDRLEISLKNETDDFVDNEGYVFLRYDRAKLAELLNVSIKSINRYIVKLSEYKLIVNLRDGQGRSNRIYITDISKQLSEVYTYEDKDIIKINEPESIENTMKGQKVLSRKVKKSIQERSKSPTINTEINNTEFINTINQPSNSIDGLIEEDENIVKPSYIKKDDISLIDEQIKSKGFTSYADLVYENGLYSDNFEYPLSEWIEPINKAIWEMYYYDDTKIKGKKVSRFVVISKLQNLRDHMIPAIIDNIIESSKAQEIKYPIAFLKTIIFNEIDESMARIQAKVNYDLNNPE